MELVAVHLATENHDVVSGATIALSGRLKTGEPWNLESQTSDSEGLVRFGLVHPLNELDWPATVFDVSLNGEPMALLRTSDIDELADGLHQVRLTVTDAKRTKGPDIGDHAASRQPGGAAADYRVSGHVFHSDGSPAPGRVVVALDRGICEESVLGTARSAEDGSYEVEYSPEGFTDPTRTEADLVVRIYDHESSDVPVATSPLVLRASPSHVVNLSVGNRPYRGPSLYEVVERALAPHMNGTAWDCLEPPDFWLLIDRTGLDADATAQFLRAQQLAVDTDAAGPDGAKVIFAMLQAGLSPTLGGLATISAPRLRAAVERAIARNWIPDINVTSALNRLKEPRRRLVLGDPQVARTFELAGLTQAQRETATDFLLAEAEVNDTAWSRLAKKSGFTAEVAQRLRATIEAVAVLGGDPELLAAARRRHRITAPHALARLGPDEWETALLTAKIPVPGGTPGETDAERTSAFAGAIARRVEAQFPTPYFAQRWIADPDLPGGGIEAFFRQNPDFDLATETVHQRLEESGEVSDQLRGSLERVEALYHLAPAVDRLATVKALWTEEIQSPVEIVRMGRPRFRERLGHSLGGITVADAVYAKAGHRAGHSLAVMTAASAELNGITTTPLPSMADQLANYQPLLSLYEQFYGPYARLHCEHCQSALSPGAYLVDLLSFLDRASDGNSLLGRAALAERRPEIELIALDCANTDTIVPYIDLVLEVLENAVAPEPGFAPQTELDAAEIAAKPEHTNLAAYDPLRAEDYPWLLQFDLDLELSRAYLAQAGVPRHELLLHLAKHDDIAALYLAAAEYLGLSPEQAELVSYHTGGLQLAGLWGFLDITDLIRANTVESATEKADLEYEELKALFESDFVNPSQVDVFTSSGTFQNLDEAMLDRAHRMGRLARLTGYSFAELDVMLSVATDGPLELVPELASIAYLHRQAGIPLADIAQWWQAPTADRILHFAHSAGYSEETAAKLDQLSALGWESPVTPGMLRDQLDVIEATPLNVDGAFDLLASPELSELFAPDVIDAHLSMLRTALGALEEGEPQQLTDGTFAANDVELTLSDGAIVTISRFRAAQIETLEETLAAAFGVDRGLLAALLDGVQSSAPITSEELIDYPGFLDDDPMDDTIGDGLRQQVTLLAKQVHLLATLEIDPTWLDAIVAAAGPTSILDPSALPVGAQPGEVLDLDPLVALIGYRDLANQWFERPSEAFEYLAELSNTKPPYNSLAAALAARTTWTESELDFLLGTGGFDWKNRDTFLAKDGLLDLSRAMTLASKLGVTAEEAWSFTTASNHPAIEAALASKYSADKWLEVSAQIHDPLREKRRDALLAWMIEHHRIDNLPVFRNALDVYAHFLIDPETSACVDTSRLVHAYTSVQQFVQRILLGLEDGLAFNPDDRREWEWRKNYRVWEANLKVFLYPENWIEPELRDDKTELFEQLESALLQDEVREDTAQRALLEYARQLHAISNLEIASLHEHEGVLYVVGRTRGLPRQYYLCQRDPFGWWSGWRKIDLDIEGDHLLSLVLNGQLHLFWPVFTQRRDEKKYQELDIDSLEDEITQHEEDIEILENFIADSGVESELLEDAIAYAREEIEAKQRKIFDLATQADYFEVQLAWSRLEAGSWAAKRMSTAKVNDQPKYVYGVDPALIVLESDLDVTGVLQITVRRSESLAVEGRYETLGHLHIDVCTDSVSADLVGRLGLLMGLSNVAVDNGKTDRMKIRTPSPGTLTLIETTRIGVIGVGSEDVPLLGKVQGDSCTVLFPSHGGNPIGRPFFVEDLKSTYLVVKESDEESANVSIGPGGSFGHVAPSALSTQTSPAGLDSAAARANGDLFLPPTQLPTPRVTGSTTEVVFSGNRLANATMLSSGELQVEDFFALESPSGAIRGLTGLVGQRDTYRFQSFYHPYSCLFVRQLARRGVDGLYLPNPDHDDDSEDLFRQLTPNSDYRFRTLYDPGMAVGVYPVENITFAAKDPYGIYNTELFFHAPILIATRLMQNQQFEQARDWIHYVFDPTSTGNEGGAEVWRSGPFYDQVVKLLDGDVDILFGDPEQFATQVAQWQANPFNPHAVARLRILASMRYVIMLYLDNLITWGDRLFRQDSIESINEAAQLYVLAAQILGPKPITLDGIEPEHNTTAAETLSGTGTTLVPALGADFVTEMGEGDNEGAVNLLTGLLTFCLPANDKLLGYWDTVADRLFKIRHCMNIDGAVRQLPLFEPPIDPALLVRAAAAGVSIQAAVAGLSGVGRPCYRFTYLLQRAMDYTNEVKSLGAAVLSALEKGDGEELAQLRSTQQVAMARQIREIRQQQIAEAEANLDSLNERKATIKLREDHFANLIKSGKLLEEEDEQDRLKGAHHWQVAAGSSEILASALYALPDATWGGIPEFTFGGTNLGGAARAVAAGFNVGAREHTFQAGKSAREAMHLRRVEDWEHQRQAAEKELAQIDKDIIAAEIRKAIAEAELASQELQLANAEEEAAFLDSKFTNAELYSWMAGQLSTLYFHAYQLAFDMARQAELAYRHELAVDDAVFIEYGHWESMRKGLLAGERLSLDLRRMEQSYITANKRDLELTKHVSLALTDPAALLQLQTTGECELAVPELLFDLDYPGHYMRRLKNVRVSIPAVTGPYTTLSCTLTLTGSKIRRVVTGPLEDVPTIAGQRIATSSAQNDAGLFQLEFRDERYLPFEGEGAVSTWQLRLAPPELAQFNYLSIADAIIHLSYQARSGEDVPVEGTTYREKVTTDIITSLQAAGRGEGLPLFLSVKHHWPDQWAQLVATGEIDLTLSVGEDRFPYFAHKRIDTIPTIDVFLVPKTADVANIGGALAIEWSDGSATATLTNDVSTELPKASFTVDNLSVGDWRLTATDGFGLDLNLIDDIALLCRYYIR